MLKERFLCTVMTEWRSDCCVVNGDGCREQREWMRGYNLK